MIQKLSREDFSADAEQGDASCGTGSARVMHSMLAHALAARSKPAVPVEPRLATRAYTTARGGILRTHIGTGMRTPGALAIAAAFLAVVGLSACTDTKAPDIEGAYIDPTGFEQVVVDDDQVIVVRSDETTLEAANAAIDGDRLAVDAGYRFAVGTLDQEQGSVSWRTIPDYVSSTTSKISRYDDLLLVGSTSYFAADSPQGQQAREAAAASLEHSASLDPAVADSEQPVLLIPDGEYVAGGREVPSALLRISVDGDDVTEEALTCEGQGGDRSAGTRTAWEFQWSDGARAGSTEYPYTPEVGEAFFEKDHIDFHKIGSDQAERAMTAFRESCGH